MKLALYTVLFLVCNFVAGQTTYFNKRQHIGSGDGLLSVLEIDSGYIFSGRADSKVTLLKLDYSGNMKWSKQYGESGIIYYVGSSGSMIKTFKNGYALGGNLTTGSDASTVGTLWLFDNNGDTIFTRWYGDTTAYFEVFYQCKQTPDSGFILIGTTDAPTGGGTNDIWLVKTDKDGNFEWEKTYGGGGEEYGFNIELTPDGGYILGGHTTSFGAGNQDTYIIKTDSMGISQWSKTYGGIYLDCSPYIYPLTTGEYILATCEGKYILSGSYLQRQIIIMKTDSVGGVVWKKEYGSERVGTSALAIHSLKDSAFVIAGQSNNNKGTPEGNGFPIGFILKIRENGDSLWYREFEYDSCEKNDDYVRDIKPTSDGGFIVAGFFLPNTSFQCNDTGTQDMWVLKLDSCGCAYPNCDIACSGDTTGVEEFQISGFRFQIYPNPTDGKFIIEMFDNSEAEKPYQISIYDILGREIKEIKSKSQKIEVDISGYGKGMYFIQVINKNGFYYARIVKH